jgi:hypothetical protein
VDAPPLVWNEWGRPTHPSGVAVDVLTLLARRNGWRLHFAPLAADNVVASVGHCKIDVGILPAEPGSSLWREENPPDLTAPYLETVAAVAPFGDAAGAGGGARGETPAARRTSAWLAAGVRAAFCGLFAIALLAGLVFVANLRVPWVRGRFWPERLHVVALDASVAGPRGGLRWLWSSPAGRVLIAVWFLGAVGVAMWQMPVHAVASEAEHAEYVAALERSLDGTSAVGMRPGGRVVECRDLVRCLQDLTRGDLSAVAAGAEEICHHVRAERLEGVHFEPSLIWPNAHAFLVPPGSPLRRTINQALAAARRDDAAGFAAIHAAYGLPWAAPRLAAGCPVVPEVKR